ncbi:vWA domain-containing protein [Halogranum gelatinilyticum]|uniref:vWA domain-containing protein n=1 Tax=Halogranum gelatinilyticum TaxID=660521 RepID=UPI000B7EF8AA|nr:vWA domain-containing protein [Halogranum gelatinilyticum]
MAESGGTVLAQVPDPEENINNNSRTMTNNTQFSISRRKVLAGLGTIGIASAGAGLGTTAFFSDTEAVNASLEAGRLDLAIDYRATYVPGTRADFADRQIDLIPDTDRDGDNVDDVYVLDQRPDLRDPSNDDRPVSEDEWAATIQGIQCDDANFNQLVNGDEVTMFELDDVKPKDEGEISLSIHLCDNPGYVWMKVDAGTDDDNGVVEPEGDIETKASDAGADVNAGELDDYTWVQAWYDADCDNRKDGGSTDTTDVMIVLDRSGSMDNAAQGGGTKLAAAKSSAKTLVSILEPGMNAGNVSVGVASYAGSASLNQGLTTTKTDVDTAIDSLVANGSTNIEAGIDTAQAELATGSNTVKVMVVLTNGNQTTGDAIGAADDAKTAGTSIYGVAFGSGANSTLMMAISGVTPGEASGEGQFYEELNTSGLENAFATIGQEILGELCFFQGSLAAFKEQFANGVALTSAPENDGLLANANEAVCFPAGMSCVALRWYLPCFDYQDDGMGFAELGSGFNGDTLADELDAKNLPHGAFEDINIVQTDMTSFGIEFAAVQCRHNADNINPYAPLPTAPVNSN